MNKKSSAKKKIITALCVTGGILLLIASFFLRDLLLRAGVVEYDSREVSQVKNKYSASLDAIVTEGKEKDFFHNFSSCASIWHTVRFSLQNPFTLNGGKIPYREVSS